MLKSLGNERKVFQENVHMNWIQIWPKKNNNSHRLKYCVLYLGCYVFTST